MDRYLIRVLLGTSASKEGEVMPVKEDIPQEIKERKEDKSRNLRPITDVASSALER
jgi:hypothetical protein